MPKNAAFRRSTRADLACCQSHTEAPLRRLVTSPITMFTIADGMLTPARAPG
jgi:hypothetical protein